LRNT
jgi:hypothetical protein